MVDESAASKVVGRGWNRRPDIVDVGRRNFQKGKSLRLRLGSGKESIHRISSVDGERHVHTYQFDSFIDPVLIPDRFVLRETVL